MRENKCRHLHVYNITLSLSGPSTPLSFSSPAYITTSFTSSADSVASSDVLPTKTNCHSTMQWRFLVRTGHNSRLRSLQVSIKRIGPRTGVTGPCKSLRSTAWLKRFKSLPVALILFLHWNQLSKEVHEDWDHEILCTLFYVNTCILVAWDWVRILYTVSPLTAGLWESIYTVPLMCFIVLR